MATTSTVLDDRAEIGAPIERRGPLSPPAGLLARVRWFFLLLGLATVVAYGAAGAAASASAGLAWPLTLAASAALVGSWLVTYRRGRADLITDLVTAGAIVL